MRRGLAVLIVVAVVGIGAFAASDLSELDAGAVGVEARS